MLRGPGRNRYWQIRRHPDAHHMRNLVGRPEHDGREELRHPERNSCRVGGQRGRKRVETWPGPTDHRLSELPPHSAALRACSPRSLREDAEDALVSGDPARGYVWLKLPVPCGLNVRGLDLQLQSGQRCSIAVERAWAYTTMRPRRRVFTQF